MAAAPQQGGQNDNSMGILWVIAGIFAAGGVIWVTFKKQIISLFLKIKLVEINFLSYFTSSLDDTRSTILTTPPEKFSFHEVVLIGNQVGDFLRIPFVAIILCLAFLVYITNSTRVYKRIYSMRQMVELEQSNWPQITPIVKLDLVKTDIDKGPWAMAMTPVQFCKKNNLLEEHKRQMQEGMSRKEWNRIDVTLKRGLSNKVFALQLGPLWQGVNRLPPHTRALFAVFAARFNGDSKPAQDLLARMAASSATQLDFKGVDEILKKHEGTKGVQKKINAHAYVLTVMATMMEACREDGVQASADFLWLKPLDRRLWYVLNTVGRQTAFPEVAGVYAHWIAEKEIGRRLLVPMVEEATNALESVLKEIIYHPDEKD